MVQCIWGQLKCSEYTVITQYTKINFLFSILWQPTANLSFTKTSLLVQTYPMCVILQLVSWKSMHCLKYNFQATHGVRSYIFSCIIRNHDTCFFILNVMSQCKLTSIKTNNLRICIIFRYTKQLLMHQMNLFYPYVVTPVFFTNNKFQVN